MKKQAMATRTLVFSSFLVALSIVLTRFLAFMALPTLRVGFGEVPLIISGLLFGPIVGGISGLAADLIGITLNTQGPVIHPGFMMSSVLWGLIPGFYGVYLKRKENNPFSFKNITLVVSFCIILISVGLDTHWLSKIYGDGYLVLLPLRIIFGVVKIIVNSIAITNIIKHLKNIVTA